MNGISIPSNSSPFQRMWFKVNNSPFTFALDVVSVAGSITFLGIGLASYGIIQLDKNLNPFDANLSFIETPGGAMGIYLGIPYLALATSLLLSKCLYKCVYRKHQNDPTETGTSMSQK